MFLKQIFTSKPLLALEIAVLLFFGFNAAKEMYKKHSIGEEVSRLEAEIGKLEGDKSELSALLSYVKTDAFVEQEAREKLNLAGDGESLVLMPEADIKPESQPEQTASIAFDSSPKAASSSNLERWWQYFFEHERLGRE